MSSADAVRSTVYLDPELHQALRLKSAHSRRSMSDYESTGAETHFTNTLDPEPRARNVFAFHRPETLAEWLGEGVIPAQAGIQGLPPAANEAPAPHHAISFIYRH